MKQRRSAMLISGLFPPEAAVGVHRTVSLCRHLVHCGWQVAVITARPPEDSRLDDGLLDMVPSAARIIRTSAPDLPSLAAKILKGRSGRGTPPAKRMRPASSDVGIRGDGNSRRSLGGAVLDWLSWWLHVPDGRSGWLAPALCGATWQGLHDRPDVLFSSAPIWTAHIVAAVLSRLLDVPLVCDFRDPWCGSWFRRIPWATHRHLDASLEKMVLRCSTRITCAWDGIRRHLAVRYPERAHAITTILNGFDPAFLDGTRPIRIDDQRCVLLHAGTFYGPRSPLPLFRALQRLQERCPQKARKILVALLGPPTYGERRIHELAVDHGVGKIVRVMRPVPHRDAVAYLKGADVALLFGQSGVEALASVPAKVYEYVGTRKPVIAVGAGQEACQILDREGCPVWQVAADDPEAIASALADILDRHHDGTLAPSGPASTARSELTRDRMATALAAVLEEALSSSRPGRRRPMAHFSVSPKP